MPSTDQSSTNGPRIFHPPHAEECPVCRGDLDYDHDDEDIGLPAAICAALLTGFGIGVAVAAWLDLMHRAGQGAMP